MAATEATFRPHVDQENAGALNLIKGGNVQGRSFGAAKSFQSNNAPLTTPRRALGDVKNTIQPSGTTAKKGLAFKSNQLKTFNKTPGATKIFQGTPVSKGLPLLQHISNTGVRQSSKQKQAFRVKTAEKPRVKAERDQCQKEVMYPFTDKDDVLPRPSYVSTILKNVGSLYHGCLRQPMTFPDPDLEDNASSLIHFETERRPVTDTFLDSLPFEGALDSLTQGCSTLDLPDINLAAVDIDSLGLGLACAVDFVN